MELKKVEAIPDLMHCGGKYKTVIDEFLASGDKFAEVVLDEGDTARNAYNSIRYLIKNRHYPFAAIVRSGRLFFVREGG